MNPKPMSLGLPRSGTVRLVPHSSAWAAEYWLERGRILAVLGVRIQAIEHVGSTAIPGIAAKPIIDIAIAVPTLDVVDALAPSMARIGYDYPGDIGIPGERIFGRGPELRTHLVHAVVANDSTWRNYLAFRDALRADAELAREYHLLKLALAKRYPEDRGSYTREKGAFIEKVLHHEEG